MLHPEEERRRQVALALIAELPATAPASEAIEIARKALYLPPLEAVADSDLEYFERVARNCDSDRLAHVAFGIAAGIRMARKGKAR